MTGDFFTRLDEIDRLGDIEDLSEVRFGAETYLNKRFYIRGGFRLPLTDQDLGGLSGFTTGLGMKFKGWRMDYAFGDFGDLGVNHRASLTYKWGKVIQKPKPLPEEKSQPSKPFRRRLK